MNTEMDVILPAAGLAKRMRGIPKFLLPASAGYKSLLEIHLENLVDLYSSVLLPTRPELIPVIESLDFDLRNVELIGMKTSTMSETILNTISISSEEKHLLIMPDTYFYGERPYKSFNPDTVFCELTCWRIREEQRGNLGEVEIIDGKVINIIDKSLTSNLKYSWGALTFTNELKPYIKKQDPHIGYAVKNALDDGKQISPLLVDGQYFDCGTPGEYVELLKKVFYE
jgi:hypothetical protein